MPNDLDARYGRTPQRRRRTRLAAILTTVVVVGAAAAWALWTGVGGSVNALDPETVAADIVNDHLTVVRWDVSGRSGTALVCAIEAEDAKGIVVGLVELTVPASGGGDRTGTTDVRTVRRASDGLIASCRDA